MDADIKSMIEEGDDCLDVRRSAIREKLREKQAELKALLNDIDDYLR